MKTDVALPRFVGHHRHIDIGDPLRNIFRYPTCRLLLTCLSAVQRAYYYTRGRIGGRRGRATKATMGGGRGGIRDSARRAACIVIGGTGRAKATAPRRSPPGFLPARITRAFACSTVPTAEIMKSGRRAPCSS